MTRFNGIPLQQSLKRKSLTPSTPALSPAANHSSPLETFEARTPIDSNTTPVIVHDGPSPMSVDVKGSTQVPEHDDRENVILKKPRLETPVPGPPDSPIETKPVVTPVPAAEPAAEPAPDDKASEEDESDDEDVIEVDADGLRLPRICVDIIMELDENDPSMLTCRNCMCVQFLLVPFFKLAR